MQRARTIDATTATTDRRALVRPDEPSWSVRGAALTAGIGLLLMAALAGVGYTVAVDGLVTPGDAARTATDVAASDGLFRLGIVSLLVAAVLDVLVAWALYRVLANVHRSISLITAAMRLVYSGAFLVAIAHLVTAVDLATGGSATALLDTQSLQTHVLLEIEAFDAIWNTGLVLFGLHLAGAGYLAYRSRFLPRTIGVLLVVAGAGYVLDSMLPLLSGQASPELSQYTFVGELLLALWLTFRSRHIAAGAESALRSGTAATPDAPLDGPPRRATHGG